MNNGVQVDISRIEKCLDQLKPNQWRQATRNAFRKSMSIVQNAVKAAYRQTYPGRLWRDIHVSAFRSGKGAMVDLLYLKRRSKGDPLYHNFVMRFLNQGTQERQTKKGWSRGSVSGSHFFEQGVNSSMATAQATLMANLENALKKKIEQVNR